MSGRDRGETQEERHKRGERGREGAGEKERRSEGEGKGEREITGKNNCSHTHKKRGHSNKTNQANQQN